MNSLRQHLALRNARFVCRDTDRVHSLVVHVASTAGSPATESDLQDLKIYAASEYVHLAPLYENFNGVELHRCGDNAGLVVPAIAELPDLARSFKSWLFNDESNQWEFQRRGVAFATIQGSGNFFVCCDGAVYYSDHDGGGGDIWGTELSAFFDRVTRDPARFLYEAGCHTRYSDGSTSRQYIPERLEHD